MPSLVLDQLVSKKYLPTVMWLFQIFINYRLSSHLLTSDLLFRGERDVIHFSAAGPTLSRQMTLGPLQPCSKRDCFSERLINRLFYLKDDITSLELSSVVKGSNWIRTTYFQLFCSLVPAVNVSNQKNQKNPTNECSNNVLFVFVIKFYIHNLMSVFIFSEF